MNFLSHRVGVAVLLVSLAVPMSVFGQSATSNNNTNNATRNIANNVNTARNQVTAAQNSLAAAQSHFKDSESKNRLQTRHVQTVRAKVFEEHDKSSVLEDARKEVDRLDKEFKSLMRPIVDHVRAQSDYRALAKKHDAAERMVKDEGSEDETQSEGQRNRLLQEVMTMQTEMRQMEKSAVLENTEAKTAYTNVQAARAKLKELCQQRDQEIEADSNLSSAFSDLKSSKQELEQSKVQVTNESQKLAAAEQQLMAALAAQAAASRRTTTRRRN